jgi:hypothetical protein
LQADSASYGTFERRNSGTMAVGTDNKAGVDNISDDVAPTAEAGYGPSHSKLEPPPLVAAMSQVHRLEAEARLVKKIDTRLLPMIILMYIMNYVRTLM